MKTVIECPVCGGNAKYKGFRNYKCITCKSVYKVADGILYIMDSNTKRFSEYYQGDKSDKKISKKTEAERLLFED